MSNKKWEVFDYLGKGYRVRRQKQHNTAPSNKEKNKGLQSEGRVYVRKKGDSRSWREIVKD